MSLHFRSSFCSYPVSWGVVSLCLLGAGFPAVAAGPERAPRELRGFTLRGKTGGQRLVPGSADEVRARLAGEKVRGRRTVVDRAALAIGVGRAKRGDRLRIPLADGEEALGVVQLVQQDGPVTRLAGVIAGKAGTFSLSLQGAETGGWVEFPEERIAWTLRPDAAGDLVLEEGLRSDLVCERLPAAPAPGIGLGQNALVTPPLLSSRPTAAAVIYIDFDGETVTDSAWNGGSTIVAVARNLTESQMTQIWQRVSEDFAPFNIDVTTDVARYNGAATRKRTRCIVTSTDTAAPGAGGVAMLNSFNRAGRFGVSSTIPCWVFNSNVVGIAEAVSHEVGHTLGLDHDGRTSPAEEYYEGHGSGATGWAPIMGAAYYKPVTQWSQGEYAAANNTEDDMAVIAGSTNGFGYIADEAGGTTGTAAVLPQTDGSVSATGVVSRASDADVYAFTTTGGSVSLNVAPAAVAPDLDVKLTLLDAAGATLTTADPTGSLSASLTRSLAAGTYYLKIEGTGAPTPPATGYTNYASAGWYTVSGTVPLVPVLQWNVTALTYTENGAALPVAPAAAVVDGDSAILNPAALTITPAGAEAGDLLSLAPQGDGAGEVGVSGAELRWEGVAIGSVSGGAAGNALTISFSSDLATPAVIQAGLRRVTWETAGDAPSAAARTLTAVLSAGAQVSAPAVLTVNVLPVNDPPVAEDALLTTGRNAAASLTLTGLDPDSAALTFAVATPPAHGTLTGDSPLLTYTPDAGFSGTDSFTFTASDGALASLPAAVEITVFAPAPLVFDTWLVNEFGLDPASNPDAAQGADPDMDGLTNVEEYAYGTVPTDPESVSRPERVDDAGFLTLTFHRALDRPGAIITLQVSDDMENWLDGPSWSGDTVVSSNSNGVEVSRLPDENGGEVIVARDTAPRSTTDRRYLRLHVSRP